MNARYRPTFIKPIGHGFVTWIESANQFVLSETPITNDLVRLLNTQSVCAGSSPKIIQQQNKISQTSSLISKYYKIGTRHIKVHYQDKQLERIFGSGIEHLTESDSPTTASTFHFYIHEQYIHLYYND